MVGAEIKVKISPYLCFGNRTMFSRITTFQEALVVVLLLLDRNGFFNRIVWCRDEGNKYASRSGEGYYFFRDEEELVGGFSGYAHRSVRGGV